MMGLTNRLDSQGVVVPSAGRSSDSLAATNTRCPGVRDLREHWPPTGTPNTSTLGFNSARLTGPVARPSGLGGRMPTPDWSWKGAYMTESTAASAPTGTPAGTPDITIRETRVYRGPNYYSYEPAVHMVVDIGRLEEFPTDTLPGFTESLFALLPGLHDHQCSRGRDGGFVERLLEGTWAGHVVEHVALELERTAGHEITRGKTRSTGENGVYNVIYGYLDETVGNPGRPARGQVGQSSGAGTIDHRRRRFRLRHRARRLPANVPARPRSARRPRPSWTRRSRATSLGSG